MAREALVRILGPASEIVLEVDVERRDDYGRLLAYVWADGVMVNWLLVQQGWAVMLTYPPNVQYVEWLERAQQDAREGNKALWAIGGFDCLPIEHRRGHCD
jgi:micrococcal nuclease